MQLSRRRVLQLFSAGLTMLSRPAGLLKAAAEESAALALPPHLKLLRAAERVRGAAFYLYGAIEANSPSDIAVGIGHRLSFMHVFEIGQAPLSQLANDPAYIRQIIDYASHPDHIFRNSDGELYSIQCGWALDKDLKGNPQAVKDRIDWVLSQPELEGMDKPDWEQRFIASLRQTFLDHFDALRNIDWRDILSEQFYHEIPDFCRYFGDLAGPEILGDWKKIHKHLAFQDHSEDIEYKTETLLKEMEGAEEKAPLSFRIRPIEVPAEYDGEIRGYEISVSEEDPVKRRIALHIISEKLLKDVDHSWGTMKGAMGRSFQTQDNDVLVLYADRNDARPFDELCILSRAEDMKKEAAAERPADPSPAAQNGRLAPD